MQTILKFKVKEIRFNELIKIMKVDQRRRIYNIINVMKGIKLMKKENSKIIIYPELYQFSSHLIGNNKEKLTKNKKKKIFICLKDELKSKEVKEKKIYIHLKDESKLKDELKLKDESKLKDELKLNDESKLKDEEISKNYNKMKEQNFEESENDYDVFNFSFGFSLY